MVYLDMMNILSGVAPAPDLDEDASESDGTKAKPRKARAASRKKAKQHGDPTNQGSISVNPLSNKPLSNLQTLTKSINPPSGDQAVSPTPAKCFSNQPTNPPEHTPPSQVSAESDNRTSNESLNNQSLNPSGSPSNTDASAASVDPSSKRPISPSTRALSLIDTAETRSALQTVPPSVSQSDGVKSANDFEWGSDPIEDWAMESGTDVLIDDEGVCFVLYRRQCNNQFL